MIETVEECAACGQPSSGNDTIHRDGFDEGPEVPLCAECGDLPMPTCEEVWAMIAARRKPLEQSDASFWRVVKERSDQLTSVDYRQFAAILARAWSSQVNANPHNDDFKSIREWLTDEAETNEQCGPEMIAACEASGEIWQLIWWSSSCGHFGFVAPSYDDLVRQVLENQAGMRRADGRDSGPMGGP